MLKNWDDITEKTYVQNEGTYTFAVKSYEKGVSANDKEYHKYICETPDGEQLSVSLYLTDTALWKYKIFAKAVGINTTGQVDFDTLPEQIKGRKFIGEVVKRTTTKMNVETGAPEEKSYLEIAKFNPFVS